MASLCDARSIDALSLQRGRWTGDLDSAGKPDALHTLRGIRRRFCRAAKDTAWKGRYDAQEYSTGSFKDT